MKNAKKIERLMTKIEDSKLKIGEEQRMIEEYEKEIAEEIVSFLRSKRMLLSDKLIESIDLAAQISESKYSAEEILRIIKGGADTNVEKVNLKESEIHEEKGTIINDEK